MKLGFIGAGNMGTAILKGVLESGFLKPEEIAVFDVNQEQSIRFAGGKPVRIAETEEALVEGCERILLAVKPIYMNDVLQKARPLAKEKEFISIAAGWTFAMMTGVLDEQSGAQVLRVMPNTPAMVGEGFTAICEQTTLSHESLEWAKALFATLGEVAVLPESQFDAIVALTGSSPAYVFMFIEAMADAAVAGGMPRSQAYTFAAQAVLGSAKMVLETGKHPGELKDMVCSPAGTTIQAVRVLEEKGMRSSVFEAMMKCLDISRKM